MGQLLSCDFDLPTLNLIRACEAAGPIGDKRIAALLALGFENVWWDETSVQAQMLADLGAQVACCKVHDGGPYWFWSRAAWKDGYVRVVYGPIVQLVNELARILFGNEASDGSRAERIAALAALPGKLSQTDLAALDTVVRLGDARAVLRFLEVCGS